MPTQREKISTRRETDEKYIHGVREVAARLITQPRQRELLRKYMTGEIREEYGASLVQQRGHGTVPYTFRRSHGVFVDSQGAIYDARTDDQGVPQIYTSPNNEDWTRHPVILPYTYCMYASMCELEMRFDFINGPQRCAPPNSIEEIQLQHANGRDVTVPPPYEGIGDTPQLQKRDYITLIKRAGNVDGWLHDGQTNENSRLFAPADVMAKIRELEAADEYEVLQREESARELFVEIGSRAVSSAA